MGTVAHLAQTIREGLKEAHPGLGKTLLRKLPLAVAAMREAQTANTRAVANLLPLESERLDRREQWLRRLLTNERLKSETVLAPWARQVLREAGVNGQVIVLSLDQTDLGERFAVLMISVRVGDRALPLAWRVEVGPSIPQGESRLRPPARALGAGARVATRGREGDVASRSVLPFAVLVQVAAGGGLALPVAAEGEPLGRCGPGRH
jgi:hypothetical protein